MLRHILPVVGVIALLAATPADAQRRRGREPAPPPAPHPNAALCVPGQQVEISIAYQPAIGEVSPVPVNNNPTTTCIVLGGGQAHAIPLDRLMPVSPQLRARLAAEAATAAAATANAPPHVMAARQRYVGHTGDPCLVAEEAIVGGEDLAREMLRRCGFRPDVWARAMTRGPFTYNADALWNESANAAGQLAAANAERERTRLQMAAEAQVKAAASARPEYVGQGLYTGPVTTTVSAPATNGGGSAPSEVQTRRDMASEACMANAARC